MTALTRLLPGNSSRTRIQARIVPKTALRTTTISEQITVSSSALLGQGRGDLVPEGAPAAGEGFAGDRRQRQQHDHAQVEHDRAGAEADPETREANSTSPPLSRKGCCCCRVCLHQPEVETPSSPSIFATEPVSSSKKSSLTLPQPPNWLILNSFGGGRELLRVDQFRVDRAVAVFSPDFLAGVRPDELEEVFGGGLRGFLGDARSGFRSGSSRAGRRIRRLRLR